MNNSIPYADRIDQTSKKRRRGRSSVLVASESPEIALAKELGRLVGKHLAAKRKAPFRTGQPGQAKRHSHHRPNSPLGQNINRRHAPEPDAQLRRQTGACRTARFPGMKNTARGELCGELSFPAHIRIKQDKEQQSTFGSEMGVLLLAAHSTAGGSGRHWATA